ncbi:S8 family serine peptidase, partial [Ancylomarina sp.]|uniref:S8 family serine peptidase n=1 Tax=Ancylomarina sp. TaxID=1970196 RepID=UPI0035699648
GVAGGTGNNDGVKLMSAQIFTEDGGTGDYPAAIVYGADNGAVISQNSWGYNSPGHVEQTIHDAIDYFVAEAGQFEGSPMKGGLVFFAAGNDNADGEWYPGYYETAIAVASIGADFKRAAYSNYGTWVEIAAPGGDQAAGTNYGVLSTMPDDKYGYLQGTSMACPHMSGVAALVVSKYGNGTFTSEDLKKHILSGTQDIDQYNPGFEGKLGIGYVDTWLALQNDQGIAPNAITDLALDGIAQDFASISWTIPADEDDIQPTSFEVLYHTEAITSANAEMAQKISLTERYEVGATKQLEISELEPTTTYYVAVRSIDRWGNVSELSNVISGTTNEGPAINTDQASMDFAVDAAVSTTTNGTFTILNEAAGVLKWNGSTRQTSISLSYNAAHLNYPKASIAAGSRNIRQVKLLKELEKSTADASPMSSISPMARFYEEMSHAGGSIVVGDMDTTLTNSSAIRFKVNQAQGFNMTHVKMMLKHNPTTGPMIMEIYQGEEMNSKSMVYAQEVTSYYAQAYTHQIQLDEQLYFPNGTSFWIVFHVPSSNLYPLGIGYERQAVEAGNNLMSFDMGHSWITLDEALGGDTNYSWGTTAVSKNEHLGNFITLNPTSGVVEANDSQSVDISLNASTLINGTYGANVLLKSNDGDNKIFRMPVSLEVSGHEPLLVNEKVVDFGSVFYGHSKEMTITIKNTGYGNFNVADAISMDDQFKIVSSPYQIAARDQAELTIRYIPDGAGNDNGTIDFTDYNGHTHSINLFGVAAEPSQIQLAPAEVVLADMVLGDTTSTSFTITNTGGYPLEYAIPAFAPNVELEGITNIHKHGYTLESNVDGDTSAEYTWNDISGKGVEVSDFFKDVSWEHRYLEVDMGFEFPFYGKNWSKINLTRYGILSMDPDGILGSCMPASMSAGCSPDGFISALGEELDINKGGKIFYHLEPGKFIVQYQDVIDGWAWDPFGTYTFQIVLFYNGDVEFRYKDIERMDSYLADQVLIGISDPYHADGFLVNGNGHSTQEIYGKLTTNETVFRVNAPGQQLIKSVSEPYGMIKVGESKKIDVEISSEGLYESDLFQRLAIVSNDPFTNPEAFTVKVDVTSGGLADIIMNRDNIDMGQVFQGGEYKDVLLVKNEGTKDVDITSITLANNKFNMTAVAPVLLKAKSSYFIDLDLITTDLGVVSDVLTVNTSDGKSFTVNLLAEVIPAPGIVVDVTPISETLNAGELITKTITIENNGESALEFVLTGNDWLYLSQAETMDAELKNFSYYPSNSDQVDGPAFKWEELLGEGERISPNWFWENEVFWRPVALPYELDFYEQKTDTIWIGWQGAISMSKPAFDPVDFWPVPIPNTDEFNNIIAPYFAYQTADIFNPNFDTEVGIFFKVYDDRVVVEWKNFLDMWGMGSAYSFEAILYKNGIIKFQYLTDGWSTTSQGIIGVENADGTEGVQLAAFQDFFKEGMAATLTPGKKQIVPAGETKELKVALNAKHLNKGEYISNFRFYNNTPQNGEVVIPVSLTVNGDPVLQTINEIAFGEVMAYEVKGDYGPEANSYFQEFEVTNTGKADLEFYNIAFEHDIEAIVEMSYFDPYWGVTEWIQVDPWSLPILKPSDKLNLRVRFMPSGSIAEVSDNIVFETNLAAGDYSLPVHATVILPPVMEVAQDSLSVMANTPTHTEVKTVTINNTDGLSPLKYQMGLNFLRDGEEQDAETTAVYSSESNIRLVESKEVVPAGAQVSNEETYNNVLEYDTFDAPTTALGFGAES